MSAVLDDNIGFDEPAQDAPPSASNDRNALAITQDMGRVQSALSEFDRVSAGLAALEARYPKDAIYDVESTKGMKDAVEHRAAWRDPRIMVEKARKMAKAPLIALGKNIDARASWLTDRLRDGEEPVDRLIKAEEARREAEKQARINAEAGRILAIQEALAEIAMDVAVACGKTSSDVQALLDRMQSTQPDPLVFQEMVDQARAAWAAGITKLETAHKAKLWDEAEQARIAAEQAAETRRREEEQARLARVAAEQAATAAKLAAEMAEFARQKAEFEAQQEAARVAALRPEPAPIYEEALAEPMLEPLAVAEATLAAPEPAEAPAPTVPAAPEPTMKLGEINTRIAPLAISADGLLQLGFAPLGRERSAVLFRASDFELIRDAAIRHLQAA